MNTLKSKYNKANEWWIPSNQCISQNLQIIWTSPDSFKWKWVSLLAVTNNLQLNLFLWSCCLRARTREEVDQQHRDVELTGNRSRVRPVHPDWSVAELVALILYYERQCSTPRSNIPILSSMSSEGSLYGFWYWFSGPKAREEIESKEKRA